MIRRLFFILSLVAMFGLGQQGVALHAISHLADGQNESQQRDKSLPHSQSCEKCGVYAELGSAVTSGYTLPVLPDQPHEILIERDINRASRQTFQYAARAPPILD